MGIAPSMPLGSKKLAFLCGAGVSLDPPSNFPVASTILDRLLRTVSYDENIYEHLKDLCDPDRPDKQAPGDYIRFELLLDVIQGWIDSDLEVLDFVQFFQVPNALHLILASQATKGAILATTNFDHLFEVALLRLGASPVTICSNHDFERWRDIAKDKHVPVFKLHGSYLRFTGGRHEDSKETIKATLSGISQGLRDLTLPGAKANFLREEYSPRHLVVAGYSGSDDFDIMPTLIQLAPLSTTWIDHRPSAIQDITTKVLRRLQGKPRWLQTARDRFFLRKLGGADNVRLLAGRTRPIIEELCGPPPLPEEREGQAYKIGEHLARWQEKHASSRWRQQVVAAEIYYRLSKVSPALDMVDELLESEPYRNEKRHLLLALYSRLLINRGSLRRGLNAAERSVAALTPRTAVADRVRCLHQLAFSLYRNGAFSAAEGRYRECLALTSSEDLIFWKANCTHDLGMIRLDRGQWEDASRLFQESIVYSEAVGDLRHVMWSVFQLGILSFCQGDFSAAEDAFRQSQHVASVSGDLDHVAKAHHELGLVAFYRGDLSLAEEHFSRSLDLNIVTNSGEFQGVSYQHLGIVQLERGKFESAAAWFAKAERQYHVTGDFETLAELRSYWVEYHLLHGAQEKSLKAARRAVEAAESQNLAEYQFRAHF